MTLEQLEVINAVVETGSFRSAAERLNRSQPALSAAVKTLEDEFNLKIFDRGTYRPTLTPAGTLFLNAARETLSSSQTTARLARELATLKTETHLHVSADPLIAPEVLALIALECSRPLSPTTLVIQKSILRSSLQRLLKEELDFAIAACPEDEAEKIEAIFLERVTMVGAISRKLLQEKKKASAATLKSNPQVFAYDLNQNEDPSQKPLEGAGTHQRIFVPDHATKLKLIESGIGWGRISMKEFKETEDLVMIDRTLLTHVTLDLCLIRSKKKPLGPIGRAVWAAFEKRKA